LRACSLAGEYTSVYLSRQMYTPAINIIGAWP
jgi:hypothetical protein